MLTHSEIALDDTKTQHSAILVTNGRRARVDVLMGCEASTSGYKEALMSECATRRSAREITQIGF